MIEKKIITKSPVMANTVTNKPVSANPPIGHPDKNPLFHKENYLLMLAGLIIIVIGMMVMSGGKSNDPKVFDQKEVYSTTRITIAPILIVIGLGLEVFAIFKKPKVS
jgi:heme/copper-type cytochrome/quinol oxidase subunit 2